MIYSVRYAFVSWLNLQDGNGLVLTHLRPTRSATVPLRIAPSIAPMVIIEPNTAYCMIINSVDVYVDHVLS
jgi:hypothetical protein